MDVDSAELGNVINLCGSDTSSINSDNSVMEVPVTTWFEDPSIIDGQYTILQKIHKGNLSSVYAAQDTRCNQFAVKIPTMRHRQSIIGREAEFYRHIIRSSTMIPGIPVFKYAGMHNGKPVTVLERLGLHLGQCASETHGTMFPKSLMLLSADVLDLLCAIHKVDYVHGAVQPSHIMLDSSGNIPPQVHLVDWSHAIRYVCPYSGDHIPSMKVGRNSTNWNFGSYVEFSSMEVMRGRRPSRRDDLESLLYTMMFLRHGRLPWSSLVQEGESATERIIEAKQNFSVDGMRERPAAWVQFAGVPEVVAAFWEYIKGLAYEEEPRYGEWACLFRKAAQGMPRQKGYEWMRRMPEDRRLG